eukprot:scaffold7358_cov252-Pinguiococcus_pyrenoidosus.AAC.10
MAILERIQDLLRVLAFLARLLLEILRDVVFADPRPSVVMPVARLARHNLKELLRGWRGVLGQRFEDLLKPVLVEKGIEPKGPLRPPLEQQGPAPHDRYSPMDFDDATNLLAMSMLIYQMEQADQGTTMEDYAVPGFKDLSPAITPLFRGLLVWSKERLEEAAPGTVLYHFQENVATEFQSGIFLCEKHKFIAVAFRGTEGLTNTNITSEWLGINALAIPVLVDKQRPEFGKVHLGFNRSLTKGGSYDTLVSKIEELLERHPDHRVLVTGHSLGGALATVFSFKLAVHFADRGSHRQVTLGSFASPRTGNGDFKAAFEALPNLNHNRFVNRGDPVASVPPLWLPGGWRHNGLAVLLELRNGFTFFQEVEPDEDVFYFDPNALLHLGGAYQSLWTAERSKPW